MAKTEGEAAPVTAVRKGAEPVARELPWRAVTLSLIALSLAVVAVSLAVPPLTGRPYDDYDGWLRHYLDVGREGNFPTWWSASLHLLAAAAFTVVGLIYLRTTRSSGLAWLLFALMLLAFSADEASLIHDRARHLTNLLAPENDLDDGYAWLGVGIPVALGVLLVAGLSARRLPVRPRRLLLLGTGIFLLGAVGMEIVHSEVSPHLEIGFVWVAIYHLEELLEMVGVSVILAAPLAAVRYRFLGPALVLEPVPDPVPPR